MDFEKYMIPAQEGILKKLLGNKKKPITNQQTVKTIKEPPFDWELVPEKFAKVELSLRKKEITSLKTEIYKIIDSIFKDKSRWEEFYKSYPEFSDHKFFGKCKASKYFPLNSDEFEEATTELSIYGDETISMSFGYAGNIYDLFADCVKFYHKKLDDYTWDFTMEVVVPFFDATYEINKVISKYMTLSPWTETFEGYKRDLFIGFNVVPSKSLRKTMLEYQKKDALNKAYNTALNQVNLPMLIQANAANQGVITQQQIQNQIIQQQMNDFAMQQAVQASNRAASLSMTGGMNPFMFG